MISLIATSLPFSVPTNSSCWSTVSTAVFLKRWNTHVSIVTKKRRHEFAAVSSSSARAVPVPDVYRNQVVEVQAAPLFYICRASGAEESPAHLWTGAGQKNGGQLLSEARLAVFKQLIGLIDNQPLHTEKQHPEHHQSVFFLKKNVSNKETHRAYNTQKPSEWSRSNVTCWDR